MAELSRSSRNSFGLLWAYLRGQFEAPVGSVSFWVYLVVAILGLGALGIYVELYKFSNVSCNSESLLTAIYTYFPAVTAGAWLQMTLDANGKKYIVSFAAITMFILILLAFLHAVNLYRTPFLSFVVGIVGICGSTLFWWTANGGNQSFQDFDPTDSLGGRTESEPQGDASGFKV